MADGIPTRLKAIDWQDWTHESGGGIAGVGRHTANRYHLIERGDWHMTICSSLGDVLHAERAPTRSEAVRTAERFERSAADVCSASGRVVRPPTDRGAPASWLSALRDL